MTYKVQKPCKICGKLYTPCGDCERDTVAFHWRTVTCSYDCGQVYLKRVLDARDTGNKALDNKISGEINKEVKSKKHTSKFQDNKESEQIE